MADTETFEHYSVLKKEDGHLWELGRGAMGVTYKAFDNSLRCHVALKVINATYLDSDMARQRFQREARAAAALSHPNVASVFHLGQSGENYFYAMEFIKGETLEAFVRRRGPLPALLALRITAQVARALRAASREGLIHRDIKPANLMLVNDVDDDEEANDDEIHVKVIDFGLAKVVSRKEGVDASSATLTVAGFVGTPHFASPEQLEEKDLDVRSDIYSLGVTLWYMLTGKPPFSGAMMQVISQHLTRTPPFEKLQGQPPEVVRLLEHLLQKDAADRPQTASELRREIEGIINALTARSFAASSSAGAAGGGEPLADGTSFPTEALGSDQPLTARQPETGVVVAGRYRLLQEVAKGLHGTLFKALELDSGRAVALKILPPELLPTPEAFTRLEQELEAARNAPHPNLLQVFSLERTENYPFLTYEWVNGFSAVDLLRHRQQLTPEEAIRLLEPLTAAADHVRETGLHELDYGPAQVLLAFETALDLPTRTSILGTPLAAWPFFRPKLFPLSLTPDAALSPTWMGQQTVISAPAAALPGALRQLALLTYELLGGAAPAVGTALRVTPLPALTERANAVLREALSEQGAERFPNVSLFVQALRESLGGAAELPGRATAAPPPLPVTGQNPAESRTGKSVFAPPPLPVNVAPPGQPPPPLPAVTPRPSLPVTPPPPLPKPTPTPPSQLMPVLILGGVLCVLVAALGGGAFFVWRAFSGEQRDDGKSSTKNRSASPAPTATPAIIVSNPTPPPRVNTPAPTAAPTPANTREMQMRQALAEVQRLNNAGATVDAFMAYVKLTRDFPEVDQSLSRLDSIVTPLRTKPLAPELESRRFQQLRAAMESAAGIGSDEAMLYLGDHLTATEPNQAVEWYRKAAAKGRPEAMLALGDIAFKGTANLPSRDAAYWYGQAAEKGYVKAKVYLAECYEDGKGGVERNFDSSFRLLNEALGLEPQNPRALEKLALAYERGHGTPPNPKQAFSLMKQSVDLGNDNALGNLGVYYINGLGINRPDPRAAVALFKQGVEKNNTACMFYYARCLESGIGGLARNPAEAVNLYRAAAERGFPPARQWCQEHRVSF